MSATAASASAAASPREMASASAPRSHRSLEGALWRWSWLGVAGVLSLIFTVQPFRDPDVWWHLAMGRHILAHGIPSQEPFSFLPAAHPWVGQQWLYEVALAKIVSIGGAGLASVLFGAVVAAALVVAALSAPQPQRIPAPWLAAVLLLSAGVAAPVLGVRGQVLTCSGVAAVLFILGRWREGRRRWVWALPPLLLLWANLHAGFIAGLIIPAVALAAHRPRHGAEVRRGPLLAALVVAAAATLATPAGASLYPYIARTFTTPTLTQSIVEWMSPDFHDPFMRLFEGEAIALFVAWVASRGPSLIDATLAGGAFIATLQAQRNVGIFAVVALPQLAGYGAEAWRLHCPARLALRVPPRRLVALLSLAGALVAWRVITVLAPGLTPAGTAAFEANTFPAAASSYVGAHFPGARLYSTYEWGGYLTSRFPESRMVYIYGESAVFGDARLQQYLDIHLLRHDWQRHLSAAGMTHAVVPEESQEASALHELSWRVDCHDVRSRSLVMSAPSGNIPAAPPAAAAPLEYGSSPRC